jgi:hypothetical protein
MPSDQSAADALNSLADSAAGAGARQLAQDQLQSSSNAITRALGQAPSSPSQSWSNGQPRPCGAQSGSAGAQDQSGASGSQGTTGEGQAQGQDQSQGQNQGGQGSGQDVASGDQARQGSGYSAGGPNTPESGSPTRIDTSGDLQRVPSQRQTPDQAQADPNPSSAAPGSANASEESVNPRYSSQPTQGGDNQDIPIGLRDLVRDYFSTQGQN